MTIINKVVFYSQIPTKVAPHVTGRGWQHPGLLPGKVSRQREWGVKWGREPFLCFLREGTWGRVSRLRVDKLPSFSVLLNDMYTFGKMHLWNWTPFGECVGTVFIMFVYFCILFCVISLFLPVPTLEFIFSQKYVYFIQVTKHIITDSFLSESGNFLLLLPFCGSFFCSWGFIMIILLLFYVFWKFLINSISFSVASWERSYSQLLWSKVANYFTIGLHLSIIYLFIKVFFIQYIYSPSIWFFFKIDGSFFILSFTPFDDIY